MSDQALVLIDIQNDYCHPDGVFAQKAKFNVETIPAIFPNLQQLIAKCRALKIPVIWVKMIWDNDEEVGLLSKRSQFLQKEGLRRGTWGAEIVSDLDVQPTDYVVEKKRFSAFYQTELADLLQRLGVRQIITGGVRTDFCVESTVRDAFFNDYEVTVIADGVAGYFAPLHEGSLKVMGTVFASIKPAQEIIAELEQK
jgi:ureidoacrylate peracid hydrolase